MLYKKLTVLDIETTGLNKKLDEINFIGLHTFISPEDPGEYTILYKPSKEELLEALPEDSDFIYQNGKFDTGFILEKYGIELPISHDTLILAYLDTPVPHLEGNPKRGRRPAPRWKLTLKACAMRELGVPDWDISLEEKTSNSPATQEYLKKDLFYTRQIFYVYINRFDARDFFTYRLIIEALHVYREVESNGIYLDVDKLDETRKEFQDQYDRLETSLKTRYGDINFDSPSQLGVLLYETLNLPCTRYTRGGKKSTAKAALSDLLGTHPIIEEIKELRDTTKALTFLNDWEERHIDGRLYPTFNLHTTVTGRTSCTQPNIQQVPRNKLLKRLFTAPEGWEFVQIDYSQMELRMAALVADISAMKKAYLNGEDIHTKTGKKIAGKTEITKQERSNAKPVNFGFLYKMSYKSFPDYAKQNYGVNVTLEQAHSYSAAYFDEYYELLPFYEATKLELISYGEINTLFNRRYTVGHKHLMNRRHRADYERKCINSKVQTPSSDFALMAAIEIYKTVADKKDEIKMIGSVHDSLLFEVKKNENFLSNLYMLKSIMEKPKAVEWAIKKFNRPEIDIPIVADVEVGPWGSGEEVKFN